MAENDSLTNDINYEHTWVTTKHKFFVSVQLRRTLDYRKIKMDTQSPVSDLSPSVDNF